MSKEILRILKTAEIQEKELITKEVLPNKIREDQRGLILNKIRTKGLRETENKNRLIRKKKKKKLKLTSMMKLTGTTCT